MSTETLAVMRLHEGAEIAHLVIPAVAAHADAIAFVCHDLKDPKQLELAQREPKCCGVYQYHGPWDNHRTLSLCAAAADRIAPQFVMLWDEDEIPPARFADEFAAWKRTDALGMNFKCVWAWGDTGNIVADLLYGFGWHNKVYRWSPGVSAHGFVSFNQPVAYANKPAYNCPYPFLHLGVMTPALRAAREKRADRGVWWYNALRTIPYRADMTVAQWYGQAHEYGKGYRHLHQTSMSEMERLLKEQLGARFAEPLRVLDVGSYSVGGSTMTYRKLMPPAWEYVGSDIQAGPNVDLVQLSPYDIQVKPDDYDLVISGQCLEHVEKPWLLVDEMARVLKPGGLMLLTAPWQWNVHRYPLDCWRILPDGMMALMRDAGLVEIKTYIKAADCWGIGRKGST